MRSRRLWRLIRRQSRHERWQRKDGPHPFVVSFVPGRELPPLSLKRERIPATKLGKIAEIGSIGSPESNQRANSAAANLVAEGGKVTDLLLSVQRVICQVYDFREGP